MPRAWTCTAGCGAARYLRPFHILQLPHFSLECCKARSKHTTLVQEFLFSEKHIFYFPVQQNFGGIAVAARNLQIAGNTAPHSFANVNLAANASFQAGRPWRLTGCICLHKARLEAVHSNLLTVSPVGGVGHCASAFHPDTPFISFELSLHLLVHHTPQHSPHTSTSLHLWPCHSPLR